MLSEFFVGILVNAVYEGGKFAIKTFFEGTPPQQAVSTTAGEFPNIPIVKDALERWIKSDAFAETLEKLRSGEVKQNADGLLIDSFIEIGLFHDGLNNTHNSARRVLESFAKNLETAIFRSKDGLLLEERRAQARHQETHAGLQEIKGIVQEGRSESADWARLESHTKQNLETIPDKIGNAISLPRTAERTALDAAFQKANTVVMLGPSGCGKTVIAKSWIKEAFGKRKALWWNARSFDVQDFSTFEGKYKLTHTLPEILSTVSNDESRMVIDAIDRVFSDDAFRNISVLLKAVAAKTPPSPWRTLITCQPDEWNKVQLRLTRANVSTSGWEVIHIEEPELQSLDPVWETFPALCHLSMQLQLRSLLLKPKVLDLLATKLALGDSVNTKNWVGESDLIEWFWETEVFKSPGAAMRSNFVKRLGEKQADELQSETPVDAFSTSDQEPLDGLLNDRICTLQEERLAFSHDLYGDWARQRVLLGQSNNLQNYLQPRLGSPLWNRAVRLYGLSLLEKNPDLTQWKAALEIFSTGSKESDLARDLLVEAVIFAADPLPIYERLWPELAADDGLLLNRLLGRFLQVATLPNPMMLAIAKSFGPEAETQFAILKRIPYWPYWLPVIRFLHLHKDEVINLAPKLVAEVADTWLRRGGKKWPLRREAADLAVTQAEMIMREKRADRYASFRKEVEEVVYRAAIAGANELPERVSAFVLEACARKSPAANDAESAQSTDTSMQMGSLMRSTRSVRRSSQPWPDGPRWRVDSTFQKLCLDGDSLEPLIMYNPKLAREVLLAVLIEEPRELDEEHGSSLTDHLGTELIVNWFPPIYFRGPILFFLRNHPNEGLEFVLRFVNFVTEVWSSRRTRPNQEPFGIVIPFPESERKWIGNGDVYYWYRDQAHCPDPVVAALMALEKWFYEELDAGKDVTPAIESIIQRSNSLAFAGLLSAVGRKSPSLFEAVLRPLLGVSEFLRWETIYNAQPHDYLMIGWLNESDQFRKVAQEWYTLPHRNSSLFDWALVYYLNLPQMEDFFEQARSKWAEQLASMPEKKTRTKDELEILIARFDKNNYKIEAIPDHGDAWIFVPPEELRVKQEEAISKFNERFPLIKWPLHCREILNTKRPLSQESLEGFWQDLQRVSEAEPLKAEEFGHVINPEDATCGAIAVLLLLHRDWLKLYPEREEWCVRRLTNIVLNPPKRGPLDFEGTGTDWHWSSFCAGALPLLWAENPSNPILRECIAVLAVNPNHKTVATLFASAVGHRIALGDHFKQLQHFIRRWAVEKWNHRFDRFRDVPKFDLAQWLQREIQSFIQGAISPSVPPMKEIATEKPIERYKHSRTEWKRPTYDPIFDVELIQAAYSWLPSLDKATDEGERAEWIGFWREILNCTLDRLGGEANDDLEIDGLPYESDRWTLGCIAAVILQLRPEEHPEDFWKPILSIGAAGHYWIEDFFVKWFLNNLESDDTKEVFVREWRAMAEFAFNSPIWNPESSRLWYDLRKVWWALLGFNQVITSMWDKDRLWLATQMRDVYERWAKSHLYVSTNAVQFVAFLVKPAAEEIALDGLIWLEENSQNVNEKYWEERNLKELLAELLDNCWRFQERQIRQHKPYFSAFKSLLRKLTALQNPLAIEIQQRMVALRK